MTSTLQQEASRKFGFGARQTMNAAQRLYEAGHITYMRTDGIDMAPEAVMAARDVDQAPATARLTSRPVAAHVQEQGQERPGSPRVHPADRHGPAPRTSSRLEPDQRKLYDLIWKRSIASQMEAARFERTTVDIASADEAVGLRATGQVVTFDGFLKVYIEGRDDEDIDLSDDGDGGRLPQIVNGERADKRGVTPEQHFTQPPPRYTEATLVKRMEELGIGRPSTYASIVSTIQEREYVRKEKNRLFPEDKGRLVTAFLANYFGRYVDYDFTADLEEDLDRVTTGEEDWKALLARFWARLLRRARRDRGPAHHRGARQDQRGARAAPLPEDPRGPRAAPLQGLRHRPPRAQDLAQRLGLHRLLELPRVPLHPPARRRRRGRRRRSTASSSAPARSAARSSRSEAPTPSRSRCTRAPTATTSSSARRRTARSPRAPRSPRAWTRPRSTSSARSSSCRCRALIGRHPEDGEPVEAGIGRFGPFVKHGKIYANIRDPEEVFTIGMNRAVELLAQKAQRGGRGAAVKPLRELGDHPDGGAVARLRGPLRALREVGEGQRHPPEGDRPRGGDPRAGARADRRQGPPARSAPPQAGEEGRREEARGRKPAKAKPPPAAAARSRRAPRPADCRRQSRRDCPRGSAYAPARAAAPRCSAEQGAPARMAPARPDEAPQLA